MPDTRVVKVTSARASFERKPSCARGPLPALPAPFACSEFSLKVIFRNAYFQTSVILAAISAMRSLLAMLAAE
jgi:hypothetical protein